MFLVYLSLTRVCYVRGTVECFSGVFVYDVYTDVEVSLFRSIVFMVTSMDAPSKAGLMKISSTLSGLLTTSLTGCHIPAGVVTIKSVRNIG